MKLLRKTLFVFIAVLTLFSIVGCKSEETTEPKAERNVKTYVDWSFNELNVGDPIPDTAIEGAGFEVVRKDDGETWISSSNPSDWSAIYFGTPDESGNEIFLKDWSVSTVMYLPEENEGLSNDGGIPILVGSAGRYDVAVNIGGEESQVNVWHAGNTANGPMATSSDPEKGAQVESLNLQPGVEYTFTVLGRYEGMTDEGDEFFTIYIFIDDKLIVKQDGLAYWTGGFGIRAWQSAIEYRKITVSDFPLLAPDGKDYYNK